MTDKAIEAAVEAVNGTGLLEGDESRSAAMAAVQAYLAEKEAQGSVMAPVEATETMVLDAVVAWHNSPTDDPLDKDCVTIYRAMIAARPQIGAE